MVVFRLPLNRIFIHLFYNRQLFSCLGNLYCEIQTTFLTEFINPLILLYI